jgi:4-hydroxybenzoate polyprenyltransferase
MGKIVYLLSKDEVYLNKLRIFIRAIRLYQWVKNTLVFFPAIASHEIFQYEKVIASCLAFLSFSLLASAVYLINDILDLRYDRSDPVKSKRPISKGELKVRHAIIIASILLIISLFLALSLPINFVITTSIYLLSCILYSVLFKKFLILDMLILAGLYLLRIFAGGFATSTSISEWLLGFSLFLFFSLSVLKRYSELRNADNSLGSNGRPYKEADKPALFTIGFASGFVSILVFVLYINSPKVYTLYNHQNLLWLITPIFTYWISRIWLAAFRGTVKDDLVKFVIKDPVSWILLILILFITWLAI